MHLSEIHLEGFKSYATRTVISGFDSSFNAITGLNGSGKSNILDAICFVLGISNLSQVRATNLQDLVYKQGQAGINKATVSLIFNNSDSKTSPIGYEQYDTITVTRQIIIGGRNKYMINGHAVQQSNVQNLFQSVGLNVNNPHFLIMQGRITKVLNMKPKETLGLIEEAAGTKMFETKKDAAVRTIEKKQEKVDQINKVLEGEIQPTLKKLQKERNDYLQWAASNTECERLSRLVIAWDYVQAEDTKQNGAKNIADFGAAMQAAQQAAAASQAAAEAKAKEMAVHDKKLLEAKSGHHAELTSSVDALRSEVVKGEAALKTKEREVSEEEKVLAALRKAAAEGEASRAALTDKQAKRKEQATQASAESSALKEKVEALQVKLQAVRAGMTGEVGAGSEGGTVQERLVQCKAQLAQAERDSVQYSSTARESWQAAKRFQASIKSAEKESAGITQQMEAQAAKLEGEKKKLAAIPFDPRRQEDLERARAAAGDEVGRSQAAVESALSSGLSGYLRFDYDKKNMGAGWREDKVKGPVASLLQVKNEKAALALGVIAGGKLQHIVIDSDQTGQELLNKGRLVKRVSLLPLNQIRGRAPHPDQIAKAAAISGGKAYPALTCVSVSDPSLQKVVEHVFGAAFICESEELASKVCYEAKALTVTLSGNVHDPQGTLEGGSSPDYGGKPLLVRIAEVRALQEGLAKAKADLAALEAEIASSNKAANDYEMAANTIKSMESTMRLLQQRMQDSSLGVAKANLAKAQAEAETADSRVLHAEADKKIWAEKKKELEDEVKNAVAAREKRVKDVTTELASVTKALGTAEEKARKLTKEADEAGFDLEASLKAAASEAKNISDKAGVVSALAEEVKVLQAAVSAVRSKHEAAKAALAAVQQEIANADKARRKLMEAHQKDLDAVEASNTEAKRLEGEIKKVHAASLEADRRAADLLEKHHWIANERSNFGVPHSDYDFKRQSPVEAAAKLQKLKSEQSKREKSINKKVMGMIESAEREANELEKKRRIITNDKAKIESVIHELDEKKNEALKSTWVKVNKDFGSIFSTLLPGTTAKLDPASTASGAPGSVLDGLEVRVAFNGVWKESLSELSGGQRSLLALSLILALLLFKPAPMYILDEVDAALDMSHTQNIGLMIRKYFAQSQFIVVSLKQGMFCNANVIFRTKFVDGTSTVTRTVPASSALFTGGAGGQAGLLEDENTEPAGTKAKKARVAAS